MHDNAAAAADIADQPPLLNFRRISKSFGGIHALREVDFDLEHGEVHALLGENGAGKSTLMKVLFGLIQPDDGEIHLSYVGRVSIPDPRYALSLGIGLVSQEPSVVPQLDVAQNIFLGSQRAWSRTRRKEAREEAERILEPLAPGLSVSSRVESLGMAERQVVEIARALARGGQIIAFDEPTSSLTPSERDGLFDLIRKLKRSGKGIVYISHRMAEIQAISDRVTILRDGRLVARGATREFTPDQLNDLIAGRALAAETRHGRERRDITESEVVLRTENLTGEVINEIDLEIRKGEILGLAGLVGSGRTELVRTIFGADRRTDGRIYIHAEEAEINSPDDAMRHGIALIPEDRHGHSLVPMMTVEQNFSLGNHERLSDWGVLRRRRRRKALDGLMKELDIRPRAGHQKITSLSGGNQQKVVMARWLFTGANIFLFDEPTRGIDVGAKSEVHGLLRRLAEDGATVLVITSELQELLAVADRIGIMREGRLTGVIDNSTDLTEGELMKYAAGELDCDD